MRPSGVVTRSDSSGEPWAAAAARWPIGRRHRRPSAHGPAVAQKLDRSAGRAAAGDHRVPAGSTRTMSKVGIGTEAAGLWAAAGGVGSASAAGTSAGAAAVCCLASGADEGADVAAGDVVAAGEEAAAAGGGLAAATSVAGAGAPVPGSAVAAGFCGAGASTPWGAEGVGDGDGRTIPNHVTSAAAIATPSNPANLITS